MFFFLIRSLQSEENKNLCDRECFQIWLTVFTWNHRGSQGVSDRSVWLPWLHKLSLSAALTFLFYIFEYSHTLKAGIFSDKQSNGSFNFLFHYSSVLLYLLQLRSTFFWFEHETKNTIVPICVGAKKQKGMHSGLHTSLLFV